MAYTKFQIALSYFPESIDNPDSAVHRLRRWINKNPKLCEELKKTGNWRNSKSFTSRQVALIYEFLGEP